nr:7159_t:CDS:1 [Entrophospora candida]
MISNTNNKSDQSETFAHLYEVLLYRRKDIIAIQEAEPHCSTIEKLGISWKASMANSNALEQIEHEPDKKTLADSYKLLLHLVGDLIPIQKNLDIGDNSILAVEYNNVANQNNRGSSNLSLSKLFSLLLYLEEDINTIQEELGIVGHTNQEIAEEADKNARVYLQRFEKFHGPLEDDLGILIKKFADMGVKKFWSTGEGLPLFPNVSPEQLHEVFVKKRLALISAHV